MFRIGESNFYVKPGDHVWTDVVDFQGFSIHGGVVTEHRAVHGRVRPDGTVLLDSGVIVELRTCRPCEKAIRL